MNEIKFDFPKNPIELIYELCRRLHNVDKLNKNEQLNIIKWYERKAKELRQQGYVDVDLADPFYYITLSMEDVINYFFGSLDNLNFYKKYNIYNMSWEGDIEDIIKNRNNMSKIEDEEKYFSASKAHETSEAVTSEKLTEELDWIYEMINKARFNGNYSITFSNKTLMNVTKEFLKSKGFNVSHFSGTQWDPADDTTISW